MAPKVETENVTKHCTLPVLGPQDLFAGSHSLHWSCMWVCCWQDCDLGSCSEMEVAPLVGDGGSSQLSALKCLVCV